jgi:hypothetical protein
MKEQLKAQIESGQVMGGIDTMNANRQRPSEGTGNMNAYTNVLSI